MKIKYLRRRGSADRQLWDLASVVAVGRDVALVVDRIKIWSGRGCLAGQSTEVGVGAALLCGGSVGGRENERGHRAECQ